MTTSLRSVLKQFKSFTVFDSKIHYLLVSQISIIIGILNIINMRRALNIT